MEAKHESLFARITKWLRRVKKAPGIEANGTTRTSEPIETSTETNETAQPQNHSLSKLGQKLDNLTSRLEYVYGPDHILLKYRCAVIAQQMSVEHDRQRFGTSEISRPNTQQIEREQHLIPVRLWECDTLIVPRNSEAFKVWLLETLDSIVTDFARDWQADYTAPGIPVLIYKGIKDRRELEISPGIWVIDVDVEGAVVWCDIDWCDPNVDEGDIITIGKQVLESTLSFKLIPTGETETEVRCFCGARELAQQYTRAKEMITERWPATQYLQRSDTDVSFRGVTKRANPGTAQQTPIPPTQAANAETTSRQPPPDEQGLLGRKGEHPGQHEQQESYSSQEVELADALRKHQYLPMPHTGRLEPLIVQPTDIKSFSNWFIKTTDSIIDEEQFKVANGWIVLWPIETPHSPDTYGANLAIWGNYTFPSATTAQSYASVVLRSPAVTFNLLRLDSVRIQVTIEYTLVTIAPYIRKLLLKIGKAWPASEQSILDLLTTKKQEDGNQDVQRASKLHPMSRQWPSIQTDKESFHKRLSEAAARIPHDMRRFARSDDEFEIMKADVTPLPTLETDPYVLRLGLEVTCYPSLKGEKQEGPLRSPEAIGYGIEFDVRSRKGGLINVYAFGDPTYRNVFETLAKEIDWVIEHDDWPEPEQDVHRDPQSATTQTNEEARAVPRHRVEQQKIVRKRPGRRVIEANMWLYQEYQKGRTIPDLEGEYKDRRAKDRQSLPDYSDTRDVMKKAINRREQKSSSDETDEKDEIIES